MMCSTQYRETSAGSRLNRAARRRIEVDDVGHFHSSSLGPAPKSNLFTSLRTQQTHSGSRFLNIRIDFISISKISEAFLLDDWQLTPCCRGRW